MNKEYLTVVFIALCSDALLFLFQLCMNQKVKKKDNYIEYKKDIMIPYCNMLYDIYRFFHVDMEWLLLPGECDKKGILDKTSGVYEKMLEADAYYNIYKCIIDEDKCIKEHQQKFQEWLYNSIKPAMDNGTEEEIIDAFCTLYNDIQPLLFEEAQMVTKKVLS